MRSKLVFILMLAFSVSAFAFGGGGGGGGRSDKNRVRAHYGVDAMGIHIDPDHPIDPPDWDSCDDPHATIDIHGVCNCDEGYKRENDVCVVDACHGFVPTGCKTECSSSGGSATYTECHGTGTCVGNECDYDQHHDCDPACGVCKKCDTSVGSCITDSEQEGLSCADNSVCQSGSCVCDATGHWVDDGASGCKCDTNYKEEAGQCAVDACASFDPTANECITACSSSGGEATYTYATLCHGGAWVCNSTSHVCEDPCDGKTASGCIKAWNASAGECVAEYYTASEHHSCDTNKECDNNHECVCTGYMKDSVCTACPAHATCDGTNFTCDQDYLKEGDACVTDACASFDPTANECITACSSSGGEATYTYPTLCHDGAWACNITTHLCENPCDGQTPTGCVKTLTPVAGVCSETEYQDEGYACDTNKQCTLSHECVCTGYMKDSVCTACPAHATCDGTTFTCDQDYLKEDNACVIDACVQLRQDYPDCLDTCTSSGGVPTATYKTTCGTGNNWSCNATTHLCENPCDGQTPTGCVKTLAPVAGVCSETEYQPEGYECDTNKQCNGNGSCVCPDGKYETDAGLCSSCDTGGAETSEAECNQCPGNFYVAGKCFTACTETQWMEAKFDNDSSSTRQITSGICRACTSENPATAVSEESCNTCAGTRFMAPDMMGGPKCFYCDKKDIAMDMTKKVGSTTILPTESYIASCNACLNRTYNASTKKCVCDSDKIINNNECCPAGQIADPITKDQCIDSIAVCDAGEVYSYDDNACIPCQQADGKLTPDCTNACSNWNMVYDKYGYCHNPPAEGYIIDDAGKTYSCDSYIYMFGVLSKEMCDRCPDRFYAHSGSKRLCVRCDYKDPAAVYSSEDCAKCSNNLRALDPDAESPSCICNASLVTVSRIVPTWNKEAQEYVSPTTPSNIRICQELSTP